MGPNQCPRKGISAQVSIVNLRAGKRREYSRQEGQEAGGENWQDNLIIRRKGERGGGDQRFQRGEKMREKGADSG